MNKEQELIDRLIDLAFAEDIGDGDHTTLSCIPRVKREKPRLESSSTKEVSWLVSKWPRKCSAASTQR